MPPINNIEFDVAIICALSLEAGAVDALFDEKYNGYRKADGDTNVYTVGRIGNSKVVLVHMPGMGKVRAASVASNLRNHIASVKVALLVGICGGIPSYNRRGVKQDIILGDIVISDAVVQYDFGRQYPNRFETKDDAKERFGPPKPELKGLLSKLEVKHNLDRLSEGTSKILTDLLGKLDEQSSYPGATKDILFESSYRHKHYNIDSEGDICADCEPATSRVCQKSLELSCQELGCKGKIVGRTRLTSGNPRPMIHIGAVGSSDTVMKSGEDRDRIAAKNNIIAFEMEAAGMWENLSCPCVVIKGVCDYADSHKKKEFQSYAAATAAACAKVFLEFWTDSGFAVPADNRPFMPVPYPRNSSFVGRDSLLEELERGFFDNSRRPSRYALFGSGGTGKTQIAIELSYRIKEKFPDCYVFWVPSGNKQAFEQTYRDIGQSLALSGMKREDTDVKSLVIRHLSKAVGRPWLMIFDNADDQGVWDSLINFVPTNGGSTLLITRSEQVATNFAAGHAINVSVMGNDDSKRMLRTLLVGNDMPDNGVNELLGRLSFIPLAIAQAAGYLTQNQISIPEYLSLLDKTNHMPTESFATNPQDDPGHHEQINPAVMAWSISFQHIRKSNPLAAEYLSFMSCLNPGNIPRSILPAVTQARRTKAISMLASYSLVTLRENDAIDVHESAHSATRNWLKLDSCYEAWVGKAVKQLALFLLDPKNDNGENWRIYFPHLEHAFADPASYKGVDRKFLGKYGLCSLRYENFDRAVGSLHQVLKMEKAAFGPTHINTLSSMGNLAMAHAGRGAWREAEKLLIQVKEISERIRGKEDPLTLKTVGHLELVRKNLQQANNTEDVASHEAETKKVESDAGHPEWSTDTVNLASVHESKSRWKEARGVFKKAIELGKLFLSSEHPDTLDGVQNPVRRLFQKEEARRAR
ncbi:hypothetical protein TWF694_002057 [Orbilia ellipsospora]|uniref:Nucleoside phosphorylase domain-containing protein n=1 Tax=Orbilia ellipsospora TaxID=2528407 RepID=A0AAV9X4E3_9PEZI